LGGGVGGGGGEEEGWGGSAVRMRVGGECSPIHFEHEFVQISNRRVRLGTDARFNIVPGELSREARGWNMGREEG